MPVLTHRVVLAVGCGCSLVLMAACSEQLAMLKGSAGPTLATLTRAVAERPSIGDPEERQMAQESAKKFEAENEMWNDPLLEGYVAGLAQRLVVVARPKP